MNRGDVADRGKVAGAKRPGQSDAPSAEAKTAAATCGSIAVQVTIVDREVGPQRLMGVIRRTLGATRRDQGRQKSQRICCFANPRDSHG